MATKTITGLYDTQERALETAAELEAAKIPASDISIVATPQSGERTASDGATGNTMTDAGGQGAAVGGVLGAGAGLAAGLGALNIPGIGPVLTLGWLIPTAIGAAVGASGGGIVGALIGAGVSEEHAHVYAESVRRGGSLITVRVDDSQVPIVEAIIMSGRSINPVARGELYRAEGWRQFDERAAPYNFRPERSVEKTILRETTPD